MLFYDIDSQTKEDGCDEVNNNKLIHPDSLDQSPIVLVNRGECSFVQKTRTVQRAGGHVALIMDDKVEGIDDFIMADDGTGRDINIPAILISKKDGEKLIKFFSKYKENKEIIENVFLTINFQIVLNLKSLKKKKSPLIFISQVIIPPSMNC